MSASVSAFSTRTLPIPTTPAMSTELYVKGRRAKDVDGTRLGYRDGNEDIVAVMNEKTEKSHWWENIFASGPVATPEVNQQQAIVDDYLEFLDRRYHRLKDDQSKPKEASFSALKWLVHGSQDEPHEVTAQQQENALYALGVAGLASQRLLQKHHLSVRTLRVMELPEVSATSSLVVDVPFTDGSLGSKRWGSPETAASELVVRLAPVLHSVSALRQKVCAFEAQKMKQAAILVLSSLVRGPRRAARNLWKFSGGKENVVWTASVLAAIFVLLIRPLVHAVIVESVTAGRAI